MPEALMREYETLYDLLKTGPTTLGFTEDGRAVVSYVLIVDGREPEFSPIGELMMRLGRPVDE